MMQKGRVFLLAMVAFTMALGASTLANRLVSQRLGEDSASVAKAVKQVVVAATDVTYGQTLAESDLMLKTIPQADLQDSMFQQTSDVVGKIATGALFKGEIILGQRLTGQKEGTILAALVDARMRAVSVRVDDVIGVAGFLMPGNRVDVLGSRMVNQRSETCTVLQNIRVLAVDQTSATQKEAPVVVRAVTLEVSPRDSEALFKAMQEGSIHLTLRNPMDSASVTEKVATVVSEPVVSVMPTQNKTVVKTKVKTVAKPRKKVERRAGKKIRLASSAQAHRAFEPQYSAPEPLYSAPEPVYVAPVVSEPVYVAPQRVPARSVPRVVAKPAPAPVSITVIRGTTQQEMLLTR